MILQEENRKMKLRNKKTGETITLKDEGELALLKLIEDSLPNGLNVWEEVKEPLIKDEKIRKAVRAWAEANDIEAGLYDADTFSIGCDDNFISFNNGFADETKIYTIDELCGEEE